jgi:UDP-N-acetylglucosamine acyltransferase
MRFPLKLYRQNSIHRLVDIHPTARLGTGNRIGPFVVIGPNVEIGNGNYIASHAVIGSASFDTRSRDVCGGPVAIENSCYIGEFASVKGGRISQTRISDFASIGSHASIGHDAHVSSRATILPLSVIGGHAHVGTHALIGMGSTIRQKTVVGAYSTVAMGSVVLRHVPPLSLYVPGKTLRTNTYRVPKDSKLRQLPHGCIYEDSLLVEDVFADVKATFLAQCDRTNFISAEREGEPDD